MIATLFMIVALFVLCNIFCRYFKVNEVQKFTCSRKKDESTNEVSVSSLMSSVHRAVEINYLKFCYSV